MMETDIVRELLYLTGDEPRIRELLDATFPGYGGKTIILCITDRPVHVPTRKPGTDWDVVFYDLNTHEARAMPSPSHRAKHYPPIPLPDHCIAVEHRFEGSRDRGVTIHVTPRDLDLRMLPPVESITRDEEIVLRITQ